MIAEALELPRDQRAELASTLLRSLDEDAAEDPAEVAAAWATEIERRIADREAGRTSSVPFATAMADIKTRLAADRGSENR